MMRVFAYATAVVLALPAGADEPLTAQEFDAYTRGKTLTYADQGTAYGLEEYYPNNQVKWAFEGGACLDGIWYEENQNICFLYEDGRAPQCWQFFQDGNRLRAEFVSDSGTQQYEAYSSDRPLQCTGPQIGV
ncbi:hypothetical protein [Celeribacter marinus]|uniref:hypothetical protein n=1 Tax=Celeribacter marinus TaxID=1397108 RepID=UPI003F6BC543